jgi:hypothetical protein
MRAHDIHRAVHHRHVRGEARGGNRALAGRRRVRAAEIIDAAELELLTARDRLRRGAGRRTRGDGRLIGQVAAEGIVGMGGGERRAADLSRGDDEFLADTYIGRRRYPRT